MRRLLTELAAVVASVLVVGLGFVLGAPDAAAGAAGAGPRSLGVPDRDGRSQGEVPLGESVEIFGRPARLSTFWTADSVDEVVRTYSDAWEKAGLNPLVKRLDRVTMVTSVDPDTGLMRSATIMDSGEDRLVIPSVTDVQGTPKLDPSESPVPIPENAKAFMSQVADDVTALSYTANFLVPLVPARAVEFYKVELGSLGYAVEKNSEKGTREGRMVEFRRGPEWVTVVATPTSKEPRAPSFMVVTHTRFLDAEGTPWKGP
jgi:hypothetical protein